MTLCLPYYRGMRVEVPLESIVPRGNISLIRDNLGTAVKRSNFPLSKKQTLASKPFLCGALCDRGTLFASV